MSLSRAERKDRLPHGCQKRIAAVAGVSRTLVSNIVNESYQPRTSRGQKKFRRVRVLVARQLGMSVAEVFPSRNGAAA